jgi:hypothetical protein
MCIDLGFSPNTGSEARYFYIVFIKDINKSYVSTRIAVKIVCTGTPEFPGPGKFPSSNFDPKKGLCLIPAVEVGGVSFLIFWIFNIF